MKKYTWDQLQGYIKAGRVPQRMEQDYRAYEPDTSTEVLNRKYLHSMCEKYGVKQSGEQRLYAALDLIEGNEEIRELYKFLIWEFCLPGNRYDSEFYEDFELTFPTAYGDCSKFLLLFGCVESAEKDLIQRKIPVELYEDIPERMISSQLRKYQETGSCEVEDFAWDKNFYTRAIYFFDRFYFIPCRYEGKMKVYRNTQTKETVGICEEGYPFDEEGRFAEDGHGEVTGITEWEETELLITGNYMNPCGLVSQEKKQLNKTEWVEVLKPGDWMLALHVPGGEGYTPEHVQKSMQLACDFFTMYFPELPFRGFWSESWLYDNRLSYLLPEQSHIVQVQRCFYNYADGNDDRMIRLEIWGDEDADISRVRAETSLEKKVIRAILAGKRFCTTSMIVMKEDIGRVGRSCMYIGNGDLEELEQVIGTRWKEDM